MYIKAVMVVPISARRRVFLFSLERLQSFAKYIGKIAQIKKKL